MNLNWIPLEFSISSHIGWVESSVCSTNHLVSDPAFEFRFDKLHPISDPQSQQLLFLTLHNPTPSVSNLSQLTCPAIDFTRRIVDSKTNHSFP
jgi:hypothetical protein